MNENTLMPAAAGTVYWRDCATDFPRIAVDVLVTDGIDIGVGYYCGGNDWHGAMRHPDYWSEFPALPEPKP